MDYDNLQNITDSPLLKLIEEFCEEPTIMIIIQLRLFKTPLNKKNYDLKYFHSPIKFFDGQL